MKSIYLIAILSGIAVVAITIGLVVAMDDVNRFNASSERPTVDQVTKMCTEKLRDMLDTEPNKLSVNVCVGTVLGEFNK